MARQMADIRPLLLPNGTRYDARMIRRLAPDSDRLSSRMKHPRRLPLLALGSLAIAGLMLERAPAAGAAQDAAGHAWLAGAIDIHVHSDPDNVPRSMDGLDVAKLARARG